METVTSKITSYKSCDGIVFETEYECVEHEKAIKGMRNGSVLFFDISGKNMNADNMVYEDYEDLLNDVEYIDVKNDEGVETLVWLYEEFGITCPREIGRWYVDHSSYDWENADNIIFHGKKMEAIFND